jgi:hypothetical protein
MADRNFLYRVYCRGEEAKEAQKAQRNKRTKRCARCSSAVAARRMDMRESARFFEIGYTHKEGTRNWERMECAECGTNLLLEDSDNEPEVRIFLWKKSYEQRS